MSTYFVLIADFAFKTADTVGVHASRGMAIAQRDSLPERFPDGSRPIIATSTELRKMLPRWEITA